MSFTHKPSGDMRTIDPDQLYWAEIKLPGVRSKPGPLPPGLLELLADQVPVPVEDLHAVGAPTSDGRLIACAIERPRLSDLSVGAAMLVPGAIPTTFTARELDVGCLNLLSGEFEPPAVRRARTLRRWRVAAAAMIAIALVTVGSHRRQAHADRLAEQAQTASESLLAAAGLDGVTLPMLEAEIDRRQRRLALGRTIEESSTGRDAAATMAAVLERWPPLQSMRTQSLSVAPELVSFAVVVSDDPAHFIAAFAPPPGWIADEPRLTGLESHTRITVSLRPQKAGSP